MEIAESISKTTRSRYILGKQGLWPGPRWSGKEGTASALRTVEAVQVDPVTVLAQSHDIALLGRVYGYRPAYLDSLLYKEHKFFDYGGGLFVYPIEELPYWRVKMEQRKSEKRWKEFAQSNQTLLDEIRQELRVRGPLRSRDIQGKSVNHYRGRKDTGVALYYLWLTGELMSHSRQGKERVYDFLENIAPSDLQWSVSESDALQFFIRKAISQLGLITERDFRNIVKSARKRPMDVKEARIKLADMIETRQLKSIRFENQTLYILESDASLLSDLSEGLVPSAWRPIKTTTIEEVIFLSPLEYVSARGRAKDLFDFEYIWEIYKPASKRQYGPYTLPILFGERLVARMDAKHERKIQKLIINGLWFEKWFILDDTFTLAFAKGLLRLAKFLGVSQINITTLPTGYFQEKVQKYLHSKIIVSV